MHLPTFQYLAHVFFWGCVLCSYSRETYLENLKAEKYHWRKQLVKEIAITCRHSMLDKKKLLEKKVGLFVWFFFNIMRNL